jgi:cell division protein FtsW (lipid II flippase)
MAGPLGQGPGATLLHLPEAHNDMVFASLVYATGWLGGLWSSSSTSSSSSRDSTSP